MSIEIIQSAAEAEGFSLLGIAPAVSPSGYSHLLRWIEDGFAAEMQYFETRRQAYQHPNAIMEGVRSMVMLAYPYPASLTPTSSHNIATHNHFKSSTDKTSAKLQGTSSTNVDLNSSAIQAGHGWIARYASTGTDYHDTLHPKLKRLCKTIDSFAPESTNRGVVDTAPLMEREFAQLAGLGWLGKNTLLINKHKGSYFFLACVLTSLSLQPSAPHETSHCGHCTACLDACPTDAFPEAGRLDARKCISYLTIEHRESIPLDLRAKIGNWLFGCDICQEVCPWNRKPTKKWREEQAADPTYSLTGSIDLHQLFRLDDEAFRREYRKTPMWRPRRRGLLRNAAIVLGNQRDPASIPVLIHGLQDSEPIVRGTCVWALSQYDKPSAIDAIANLREEEHDPQVLDEISWAMDRIRNEYESR